MSRKKRVARYWIKSSQGIDLGPFIEEADARLARSALALFREDLDWVLEERDG